MKIYYILGKGATGKTTKAEMLGKYLNLPVFHKDEAEHLLIKELGISKRKQDRIPRVKLWKNLKEFGIKDWGEHKSFRDCFKECFKKMFNGCKKDLILEGVMGFQSGQMELIREVLGEHIKVFFFLNPTYEQWLKNRSKRPFPLKYPPFAEKKEYEEWNDKSFENIPYKRKYRIRSNKDLFQDLYDGPAGYQSEKLSEPKWKKFGFPNLKGKSFMDIACNAGWFLRKAKEEGATRIIGIDRKWSVLERAYERVPEAICYMDRIERIELKEKIDYVLCSSAFHYFTNREAVIEKISKITNYFVLELPLKESQIEDIIYQDSPDKKDRCALVTRGLMMKWLNKYFKKVEQLKIDNYRPILKCQK